MVALLNTPALLSLLKDGFGANMADIEFYTKRFPAAGFVTSKTGFTLRIVGDAETTQALEKMFKPETTVNLAQYIPASGWMAARFSVNLKDLFSGVAEFLPPSAMKLRMIVASAGTMMGTMGVDYDKLTRALSGQFLIAGNISLSLIHI